MGEEGEKGILGAEKACFSAFTLAQKLGAGWKGGYARQVGKRGWGEMVTPSHAPKGKSRREEAMYQVGKSVESGRWSRDFNAHSKRDENDPRRGLVGPR